MGNIISGEYCDKCGKHKKLVTESKRIPSSNRWTINDLAIIVLTIVGAILLLTTSLIKIPLWTSFLRLNNLAFGSWNDYVNLSRVFQYFEKAGWILLLLKVAAVALYATIFVSLVETAKKLSKVSKILRWVSLGIGILLLMTMIWVNAKVKQDAVMSWFSGTIKYGYGGILLGILLQGAAVGLSLHKDILDIKIYEFGAAMPHSPKEDSELYTEREYGTVRREPSFKTSITDTGKKSGSADEAEYSMDGSSRTGMEYADKDSGEHRAGKSDEFYKTRKEL